MANQPNPAGLCVPASNRPFANIVNLEMFIVQAFLMDLNFGGFLKVFQRGCQGVNLGQLFHMQIRAAITKKPILLNISSFGYMHKLRKTVSKPMFSRSMITVMALQDVLYNVSLFAD